MSASFPIHVICAQLDDPISVGGPPFTGAFHTFRSALNAIHLSSAENAADPLLVAAPCTGRATSSSSRRRKSWGRPPRKPAKASVMPSLLIPRTSPPPGGSATSLGRSIETYVGVLSARGLRPRTAKKIAARAAAVAIPHGISERLKIVVELAR